MDAVIEIHKSKGLEWWGVYLNGILIGCDRGVMPSSWVLRLANSLAGALQIDVTPIHWRDGFDPSGDGVDSTR